MKRSIYREMSLKERSAPRAQSKNAATDCLNYNIIAEINKKNPVK